MNSPADPHPTACSTSTVNPLTDGEAALSSWLLVEIGEIRVSQLCGSGHAAMSQLIELTGTDFVDGAVREWICDEDNWDRDEEGEYFRWRFNPTGLWEFQAIRVLS